MKIFFFYMNSNEQLEVQHLRLNLYEPLLHPLYPQHFAFFFSLVIVPFILQKINEF